VAEYVQLTLEQWTVREYMLRKVHEREQFGDCVEDGEPYPCATIRILDHDFTEVNHG
jgi:hypothetical protein